MSYKFPMLFFDLKIDCEKKVFDSSFLLIDSFFEIKEEASVFWEKKHFELLHSVIDVVISLFSDHSTSNMFEVDMFLDVYLTLPSLCYANGVFDKISRKSRKNLKTFFDSLKKNANILFQESDIVKNLSIEERLRLWCNYKTNGGITNRQIIDFISAKRSVLR